MEAAQVSCRNLCVKTHKAARTSHAKWPGRNELQKATKGGQFALHSQSIQMVVHAFLANIDTTHKLRQTHPQMRMNYPWREKRYYPVKWPAQAVTKKNRHALSCLWAEDRLSIVLPLELPENSGACSLVWNYGFELDVCVETPKALTCPGEVHATVVFGVRFILPPCQH